MPHAKNKVPARIRPHFIVQSALAICQHGRGRPETRRVGVSSLPRLRKTSPNAGKTGEREVFGQNN